MHHAGTAAWTYDPRVMRTVLARRWRAAVCAALVAAGCYEWLATGFAFFGSERLLWFHQDFPALYTAAHMVAHGGGRLLYDTAAVGAEELRLAGHPVGGTGTLAYFNPPFFAAAMAPLSAIGMERAFQAWTLVGLGLLAADVWLLWRIAPQLAGRERTLLTLAFVTLYPVSYGLQLGQFSLVLATSWAGAYLLLRSGRDARAGLALAPLLIKPELLVPVALYLAWKRRWRVFATLLPAAAAAVAVSVVVTGVPAALAYPGYLLDSTRWSDSGVTTSGMFNWSGIVAMKWDPAEFPLALAVVGALMAATLAAVAYASRGDAAPRSERYALQWLLLTLATVLVDPHLYLQDTVLVAPAAAAVLGATRPERRARVLAIMLGGWALLALGIYPNEHLHVDAFALYMAAAGVAVLAWERRRRQADAPAWDARRAASAVRVEAG
jgi:cytochrome c oxidase subunit IV